MTCGYFPDLDTSDLAPERWMERISRHLLAALVKHCGLAHVLLDHSQPPALADVFLYVYRARQKLWTLELSTKEATEEHSGGCLPDSDEADPI